MSKSRTSNAISNSGVILVYRAVHMVMQFVLRTVFIKFLGNEYTGVSTLFTDILTVLSIAELGIPTAMNYALYKPFAEKDVPRITVLVKFFRKAYAISGCVILVGGLCLVPFLDYLVTDVPNIVEDIRLIYLMYLAASASSYFLVYKSSLLRVDQKGRVITYIDLIVLTVENVVEIILLATTRAYFSYLIVRLVATVLRNLLISDQANKRYKQYLVKTDEKLSRGEVRKIMKDVYALALYRISSIALNSTSSIVISAFVGTTQVALIGNYTLLTNSIRTAVDQVGQAVRPSIGNLAVTSEKEYQQKIFDRINFLFFWLSCVCAACFFALLTPFVSDVWFDAAHAVDTVVTAVICLNLYVSLMVVPVDMFRSANGLFVQGKYRPVIMAILNIVLDLLLVKRFGMAGVLAAASISRLSTQVWYDAWLIYSRVFRAKTSRYLIQYAVRMLITVAISALAYWLVELISFTPVLLCFVVRAIVIFAAVNLLIVLIYRKTPEFDYAYQTLMKLLKKIVRKLRRR